MFQEADHRCLTIQAEVSRLQQSLDQRASQLEESRAHEKKLHENLAQLESEITGHLKDLFASSCKEKQYIHACILYKQTNCLVFLSLNFNTSSFVL